MGEMTVGREGERKKYPTFSNGQIKFRQCRETCDNPGQARKPKVRSGELLLWLGF
jgi:hypothetical protein